MPRSFVVDPDALVMQPVAELLPLRCEVALVLLVWRDLDRNVLDDAEAEALDPRRLAGVVREDPDRRQAEVVQDLVSDPPLACIGGKAELEIRLDGVEAAFLELVGLQLVEQADAAAFLRHVEKDAALLVSDPAEGKVELLAAVTAQRVEDVACQTFGVDSHEHVLGAFDVAAYKRDVRAPRDRLLVCDRHEV